MSNAGRWFKGKKAGGPYYGFHYDLHANVTDTVLGVHATARELVPSLKLANPEWVQTDCKGHPGMTSWFSQVAEATVSPGVKRDAMRGWREATRKLGVPLICHYSGIWDNAACAKHPEWQVVPAPGSKTDVAGRTCPRGGYVDGLLIPQMLELVERYEVDGFWVDGEVWAVQPCYCELCKGAFREATGIKRPPTKRTDPHWPAWIQFTRQSFYDYVTHYVNAVHEKHPETLICSNWLHTFRDPGEPVVPTDWISGDTLYGVDPVRLEARFISTRGRQWDLMLWNFHKIGPFPDDHHPWTTKSLPMLQQEAATILALGGGLQVYENPQGLRDGRLVDWRMQRLGELGRWAQARRSFCRGTEMVPQVAVLHSEAHFRAQPAAGIAQPEEAAPVEGAVHALLESHLSVDILDEWALLPRLAEFPLVVIPEQDAMSEEMAQAVREYVAGGGKVLFTGAAMYERFDAAFWGARVVETETEATHFVPAADGSFAAWSKTWHRLQPRGGKALGRLGKTLLTDADLLPHPAAVLNGAGTVAYVPWDLFRFYRETRYPLARAFVGELVAALGPELGMRVSAPVGVDIIRRKKGREEFIHLINRTSSPPTEPPATAVEEIPPVGPVELEIACAAPPSRVSLAGEKGDLEWGWAKGTLYVTVPQVEIHAAVRVKE